MHELIPTSRKLLRAIKKQVAHRKLNGARAAKSKGSVSTRPSSSLKSSSSLHDRRTQNKRLRPPALVSTPTEPVLKLWNLGKLLLSPRLRVQDTRRRSWIFFEPPTLHKPLFNYKSRFEQLFNQYKNTREQNERAGSERGMHNYLQFVTTPTADTPGTSLILHFDHRRYLIGNVAEGTQRAVVQRSLSLAKLQEILLTGKVGWHNAGGLIGLILTVADSAIAAQKERQASLAKKKKTSPPEEDRKIIIHGGENLTHLLATTRKFVFRQGMPVEVDEITKQTETEDPDPTWNDKTIKVWAMPIAPKHPQTHNPRKRSHDDISNDNPPKEIPNMDGVEETTEDTEYQNDLIRKGVISHMFNSDWRLHEFLETPLSEVKMPADIFVRNSESTAEYPEGVIERYHGPKPGSDEVLPNIKVLVRQPWPGASIETLPPIQPSAAAVSYLIKRVPQRGKFDKATAVRLGVRPGPEFNKLASGENVTTDDGKLVTPDMVLGPSYIGGGFAVIELPDSTYIEPVLERKELHSKNILDGVDLFVWLLGPGVSSDERLLRFMTDNSHFRHVVSSPDHSPNYLAFESASTAAIKLNMIDSRHFPTASYSNDPSISPETQIFDLARPGLKFGLSPAFQVSKDTIVDYLNIDEVISGASSEVRDLADAARKRIEDPSFLAQLEKAQEELPGKDAEVITLGTGSALPSKYRNVSATLLRVPGHGNYLLDCGENTLGQLRRVFGKELPDILRNLKMIWISHMHADHHLGTVSVIRAWNDETKKSEAERSRRLMISAEETMIQWLQEYSGVEDFGHDRLAPFSVPTHDTNHERELDQSEQAEFGLTKISACNVRHCVGAKAVVLDFPGSFRVAYSGDCRPSPRFADMAQGATLLIHEATFSDDLANEAENKKHSTMSEALIVGKEMGARRILLTHFSQRYQKFPLLKENDAEDLVVIFAFDFMKCKIGDFAKLAEFKPALMKLFEESTGDTEEPPVTLEMED